MLKGKNLNTVFFWEKHSGSLINRPYDNGNINNLN